jgi:hypothetical protein
VGEVMKGYELVEDEFEYGINFYFVSSGKRNGMKMIGIENFMTYESKEVYSLGFGDYDFKRLSFDDSYTSIIITKRIKFLNYEKDTTTIR